MVYIPGSGFGGGPYGNIVESPSYPGGTGGTGTGAGSGTGSTPTPVPPESISTVTGIDPNEVAAATMGKVIPIWVGGMPRMGAHIIYGPTTTLVGGVVLASFGVSFGMPANNLGNREIRELRLDGFKVWSLADGYLVTGLTFRFNPGNETQAADPLVIAAYPSAPVAHKGQCTVFIENLALTDYDNKVPFVSALIADITGGADPTDGVNLGSALVQVAASPYVNLPFEAIDISERVDAIIIAEKVAFVDLLVRYANLFLWDVVQRDTLKIIERGTVAPDLSLDFSTILSAAQDEAPITIDRQQQDELPKDLEYSYIDIDRDYEINTVRAIRPNSPVAVTVSSGVDTIALPSVHTAQEAISWVTLRAYKNENARDRATFTTGIYGYEIEPGDIVAVDAGFKNIVVRVIETLHGADWTVKITAEPVLRCATPVGAAVLDGVECVTAAWSMSRQLLSSYTNPYYEAASTEVTKLYDQTGNGRDFLDPGTGLRPIATTAGPHSRAVANFDGVDDFMDTGRDLSEFISINASYIIISVIVDSVTLNDADAQDNHALIGDAGKKIGIYARNNSGTLTLYAYNFDGSADSASRDKMIGVPLVISLRHEDGTLYIRTNNGTEVSVASGNTSDVSGDLRLALSGASQNADIKLFEATTFNCVPTEGTRNAIEQNYMAWVGAAADSSGTFTPAPLYLWLDGSTLVGSDGDALATWPDASGNAFDFTQISAADKPNLETAELNGLNVVHFDGANSEHMSGPDLTGPSSATLFYVIKAGADPTAGVVQGGTYFGTTANGPHYPYSDGVIYCSDLTGSRFTIGNLTSPLTQWNIVSISSASSDYRYYMNGTLEFSSSAHVPTMAVNPQIGGVGTFPTWDGFLAEVLLYDGALSDSNRQRVEGYLAHKWALTARLDPSHPYKTDPP